MLCVKFLGFSRLGKSFKVGGVSKLGHCATYLTRQLIDIEYNWMQEAGRVLAAWASNR